LPEGAFPTSIAEAAARLRAGELTSLSLVERCLTKIEALQPKLNAFITVTADAALASARERDAELKGRHDRGALHGIPIVHKDCFDTAGIRTTVGAEIFRNRVPRSDATVVQRLAAAGAVMLGKTHMNEFAAGMSGRNAFFGDAHNPRDTTCAAGGSSSGSACAIAAQLCLGASGTDAGGSIRLPAAWTGIVGLRPTYGLVSTAGAFPRSHSFDCAGPLAANVSDAALLLQVMAGLEPTRPAAAPASLAGTRLGIVPHPSLRAALDTLERLGAQLREVPLPALEERNFFDILLYEFHEILGDEYRAKVQQEKRFGPVVRANLERGAMTSIEDCRAAREARERFVRALRQTFTAVDALVMATAPMTALPLEAPESDFDRARQFTIPFSLAGLPAISVPCGLDERGLPLGMQSAGERLREPMILRIAAAYEAARR